MYIATLNLQTLLVLAKRRGFCYGSPLSDARLKVAAGAAVGASLLTAMLLSDVFATLGTLLLVQGVLMAAWMGVAAVHVTRWAFEPADDSGAPLIQVPGCTSDAKATQSGDISAVPEWQWVGTTAMVCGVFVGFVLLFGSEGGSMSFAATFSPLSTMILSAVATAVLPTLAAWVENCATSVRRFGAVELRDSEALDAEGVP